MTEPTPVEAGEPALAERTELPREVVVEGAYEVTGVGTMTATTEPDPVYQRGELVTVAGKLFRIERMERFMVGPGPQPGLKMGLLLAPATTGRVSSQG